MGEFWRIIFLYLTSFLENKILNIINIYTGEISNRQDFKWIKWLEIISHSLPNKEHTVFIRNEWLFLIILYKYSCDYEVPLPSHIYKFDLWHRVQNIKYREIKLHLRNYSNLTVSFKSVINNDFSLKSRFYGLRRLNL